MTSAAQEVKRSHLTAPLRVGRTQILKFGEIREKQITTPNFDVLLQFFPIWIIKCKNRALLKDLSCFPWLLHHTPLHTAVCTPLSFLMQHIPQLAGHSCHLSWLHYIKDLRTFAPWETQGRFPRASGHMFRVLIHDAQNPALLMFLLKHHKVKCVYLYY